jgi:uncharacterized protein YdeI (YjbR/CyaY-like superfamily)
MEPTFFRSQAAFRAWLSKHHAATPELLVGYYKKGSGRPSMTWPESADGVLCFGWIDGIRRRVDDESYTIRFTARRPRSIWSAVNINRAQVLADEGKMRPAGRAAFEARTENRSGIYAYEQRTAALPDTYARRMKKNRAAWSFFQAQPSGYRKVIGWWIVSAKREETRLKRLVKLIDASAQGRRLR